MDLADFAKAMGLASAQLASEMQHGVVKSANLVKAHAKSVLGSYNFGWPALKEATIARKATGDSPLLETGEMRDSIETTIGHWEAWIGTNDPKAEWQTNGTSRGIPPRPFMEPAAIEKQPDIEKEFVTIVGKAFKGG